MKKKIFFWVFVAFVISFTSCQEEMPGTNTAVESTVSFTLSQSGISSRAYSDGLTATTLSYAIYETSEAGAENPIALITESHDSIRFVDGRAVLNLKLVKDQTYDIIFWADAERAPYTFDAATQTVTVDYENATSNDENRDAFFAVVKGLYIDGDKSETVPMYRPFAQLNIGTTDTEEAKAIGYETRQAQVVVSDIYSTLNLFTGVVSGDTSVTFGMADVPTDETFPVDDVDYLAMNYLLVNEKENVSVKLTVSNEDHSHEFTRDYNNIPVQRNYRTNIYGNLLTSESDFIITIHPDYELPDNNVEVPIVVAFALPTAEEWEVSNVYHVYDAEGNMKAEIAKELISVKNPNSTYYQVVTVNPIVADTVDLANGYIAQVLNCSTGSAENMAGGTVAWGVGRSMVQNPCNLKLGTLSNTDYVGIKNGKFLSLTAEETEGKEQYIKKAYTVTDNKWDNNVYPVVRLGCTYWLGENLRATHYNDGTPLYNRAEVTVNAVDNESPECARIFEDKATYAVHPDIENTPENIKKYGYHYNFRAIAGDDGGDPWIIQGGSMGTLSQPGLGLAPENECNRSICPEGWHIPGSMVSILPYAGDVNYIDTYIAAWRWKYLLSEEQQFITLKDAPNNWSGFSLYLLPALQQTEKTMDISAGTNLKNGEFIGCIPFWISDLVYINNHWYPQLSGLIDDGDVWYYENTGIIGNKDYAEAVGAMSFPVRCMRNH